MFRTFISYKFADRKIAERCFAQGAACLVQLDIPDDLQKRAPGTLSDQSTEVRNTVAKMPRSVT